MLLRLGAAAAHNCTTDADCTDKVDSSCVIDTTGASQCVSCTNEAYQAECAAWDGALRNAAQLKCQITCETPLACVSEFASQHVLAPSSRRRAGGVTRYSAPRGCATCAPLAR